ncbi:NAD(P)-binding protein [Pluteus cervinus]|uniref:NAD(P)-binding protein n=1 Tax=Pluteus cervinus TaxID=181527 RepID=A0ACD3B7J4_9AGAR|nr:NAD(P)-binding protein [Pluteus cervinus]
MSSYNSARNSIKSGDDLYQLTTARLESIRAQLAQAPRSGKLKNKVCIITGVGSLKGIGRAAALRFAHEGAKHLYLLEFDPTNLPDLEATINKSYPDVKVTTIQGDAADEALISKVCSMALQDEGRLDVFFANAGIASRKSLTDTTADEYMNMMRVNALSCFLAIKHAAPVMEEINPARGKHASSGSIVMTASVAGVRSGAGPVDYSASKAAVNSMAQTSAYQLQRKDIRVNSICPGLIETGMTGATFDHARQRGTAGKLGQLNPLGRYGIAEEIAQVALFLASDDSSYVNGQNIAVDGGLSASHPVIPGRWA